MTNEGTTRGEGPPRAARSAPSGGSAAAKPQAWGDQRLHVLEILGNAIVGGMESYVVRLVRELPRPQFRVTALCPFESHVTQALREAHAEVLIAPIRDDPVWLTIELAAQFVHEHGVDVMHAHLANAHVLGALVCALTDRPCVATIHGRAVPMLDFEAHRMSDNMHMSVVCRAAESHALAIGVARDRLHLVPNGVPPPHAAEPAATLAASLGLPADTPLVGFVGRLSPEKAPDLFVRMAAQLMPKHARAAFVVIGDGPMRERLEAEARLLGIDSRMRFIGERRDVLPLLPSLTALVVPSHAEGMPLALMEAMAAGVPVVATSVGGIPELVTHLHTGLLVNPGEPGELAIAVDGLLDDLPWAAALGARARERAATLWPQRGSARRMGELLRALATSPRARSPRTASRVRLAGPLAAAPHG
jgi:glycosyltransferase involved in cell wall biosynthesis